MPIVRYGRIVPEFGNCSSYAQPPVHRHCDIRYGRCRVHNGDRRVQELENPLGTGHRRLQDIVLVTEVLNGAEKALRVLNKGDRSADGNGSVQAHGAT